MKLWEKFKLAEKKKNYKTVYHGFDFAMVAQRLRKPARKYTDTAELCTLTRKVWKWLLSNGEKLFYTSALLIIQTEALQA